jgi:hypothetical protein
LKTGAHVEKIRHIPPPVIGASTYERSWDTVKVDRRLRLRSPTARNGVEGTPRESAPAHVERRQVHLKFFNGFQTDRIDANTADCRLSAEKAEPIGNIDSVYPEIVVPRVSTECAPAVDIRRETGCILKRCGRKRELFDPPAVHMQRRSAGRPAQDFPPGAGNYYFISFNRLLPQLEVEPEDLTGPDMDPTAHLRCISHVRDDEAVRSSDADMWNGEVAVGPRRCPQSVAGGNAHKEDVSAGEQIPLHI